MKAWLPTLLVSLPFLGCCANGPHSNANPAHHDVAQANGAMAVPLKATTETRVVLLGTGTPIPRPDRQGPATAVVFNGRAYLFDAGTGVVRQAQAAARRGLHALDPTVLDTVFFTHLHSDHTLGYADLILTPAVTGRRSPLSALGPPGLQQLTTSLLNAYGPDISLRTTGKGQQEVRGWQVVVQEISPGFCYRDGPVQVTAFAVEHGAVPDSYGYRIDTPDRSIVISGDTAPSAAVVDACNGCDVLVHEVYCSSAFALGPPGWQEYHASHHTSTEEVAEIARQARPGLLVLTHLLSFGAPDQLLLDEVRARYDGPVMLGEDLALY